MWIKIVSVLARLGLSAVFLVSGGLKAASPADTEVAVRAYQLLPNGLVHPVALFLPFFELALGLLLLVGIAVRWVAVVSALTLAALIFGVVSAWARGLSIDCGCFGGGGFDADVTWRTYLGEVLRDIGFIALAVWLMVFPRTPGALGPRSRAFLTTRPALAQV